MSNEQQYQENEQVWVKLTIKHYGGEGDYIVGHDDNRGLVYVSSEDIYPLSAIVTPADPTNAPRFDYYQVVIDPRGKRWIVYDFDFDNQDYILGRMGITGEEIYQIGRVSMEKSYTLAPPKYKVGDVVLAENQYRITGINHDKATYDVAVLGSDENTPEISEVSYHTVEDAFLYDDDFPF